jgi:proteasome lid subunit RPN8/RPN11
MILRLKRRFVDLLSYETEKVYPIEACALLFGRFTTDEAIVEQVEITQNRLDSTSRFEVAPEKVAMTVSGAEKKGLELVALFHSHPMRAVPSEIDLKFMKMWPDTIWLILSSINGSMAAFKLSNSKIKKVSIRIEG